MAVLLFSSSSCRCYCPPTVSQSRTEQKNQKQSTHGRARFTLVRCLNTGTQKSLSNQERKVSLYNFIIVNDASCLNSCCLILKRFKFCIITDGGSGWNYNGNKQHHSTSIIMLNGKRIYIEFF